MMRSLVLAIAFMTACSGVAQVGSPIRITGRFDAFTTDEMGNIYALHGDELEIFDRQGRSWLRNSVKTFGRIHAIDAFYSLKPMIFSPEQGQLAVLDNTLSVQGSIMNLTRSGFPQVVLVCMSVQNSFWFFDERDLSLIRVDPQLRTLANSGRLDQLLGFTPKPIAMQEHDSWLYVNDPAEGILVFDLFGTYARTIPIKGAASFEVRGGHIYFFDGKDLHIYDMRTFTMATHPLPAEVHGAVQDVRVERGFLYLLGPEQITVRALPRTP